MTTTIEIATTWDPAVRLLRTALRGPVAGPDVEAWAAGLAAAVAALPAGTRFKLLVDLHGYDPADLAAHKGMRDVVPTLLATHGMRPAVKDLFEELPEPAVTAARDVVCTAFANVHHDEGKMGRYEAEIGKPDQRFFTDAAAATAWIMDRP